MRHPLQHPRRHPSTPRTPRLNRTKHLPMSDTKHSCRIHRTAAMPSLLTSRVPASIRRMYLEASLVIWIARSISSRSSASYSFLRGISSSGAREGINDALHRGSSGGCGLHNSGKARSNTEKRYTVSYLRGCPIIRYFAKSDAYFQI